MMIHLDVALSPGAYEELIRRAGGEDRKQEYLETLLTTPDEQYLEDERRYKANDNG